LKQHETKRTLTFIVEILLMKTKLLLVIALGCAAPSFSQKMGQDKIDSLITVLKTTKQDSTKVKTLNVLAYEFRGNNPDTAIYFANEALALATKANYKIGIANAHLSMGAAEINVGKYQDALNNNADALKMYDELLNAENTINKPQILSLKARAYANNGNIYDDQGNYSEALKNNSEALKIREEIGDKAGIAASYNNMGNIYSAIGNYPEALANFFAALKIKEEIGDKKSIANSYNNLGNAYYSQHEYAQALKYHLAALKIRQKIDDKSGIASSYNNIGIIYDDNGNYSDALKYQLASLKIENQIGDAEGIAFTYDNIGLIYSHQKDYNKALQYFLDYLKSSEEIEDKSSIADAYNNLGAAYTALGNTSDASLYLNKGLSMAKEVGSIDFIKSAYEEMAQLDSVQGNFKQSLEHYKLYVIYRDSLFNKENTKKIVQSQMQYEFDKKESLAKAEQDKKDAETKRARNQQYFTIAALAIVVLAVIIIAIIQYRSNQHKRKVNFLLQGEKQKVESTLSELKSTQAQLIQSEKMASLGELTAGIAHEIQNPLNFVNNFSEVNRELISELAEEVDKGNTKEVKAIANDIKDNEEKINYHGKRADTIVKNMLQHSRQTKGVKDPTDINVLCDEYLRLSYHGLRAKDKSFNADFKTDFDERIGKINIVPQDIGRVLLNLFNNAFYAVSEKQKTADENYKPLVTVATKSPSPLEKGWVEVIVSDNGNGIPQNIVDKIFQPFFTTKPTGQGTGLGLSLSYDIVKAHSGDIKVETKESEGTTFTIHINS
jgi:two-component system NtrC family sensor kinase